MSLTLRRCSTCQIGFAVLSQLACAFQCQYESHKNWTHMPLSHLSCCSTLRTVILGDAQRQQYLPYWVFASASAACLGRVVAKVHKQKARCREGAAATMTTMCPQVLDCLCQYLDRR